MDEKEYKTNDEYIKYIDISNVKTIENNINKKDRKNKKFKLNFIPIIILTIIAGLSVGLGFGAGYNLFYNTKYSYKENNSKISENINNINNDNICNNTTILNDTNIVGIIKNIEDSVVSINVNSITSFFNRRIDVPSAGSGIIFHEDENKIYVVTNNHVIEGASTVTISIDDDRQLKANFIGSDSNSDIAVISVNKKDIKKDNAMSYKVAEIGDSNFIQVGEKVIAIGNALGQGKSATTGIISVKNKQVTIENRTLKMIQTDAAINQGNSGGALVNLQGQVIGINTAKLSGNGVEGMGYAIPSDVFKPIIYNIIENGSIKRPYIGIRATEITEEIRVENNLPSKGIYIISVEPNGSAYLSGIRTGDIIIGFNNKKITTMETLQSTIKECKVGDIVPVDVLRGPKAVITLNVEIMDMNNTDF